MTHDVNSNNSEQGWNWPIFVGSFPQDDQPKNGRICDDCRQGIWSKIRMSRDKWDEAHKGHAVREVTQDEYEAHYGRGRNG